MALTWDIGKVDGRQRPNDDIVLATLKKRRADIARRGVLLLVCGARPGDVAGRQAALLAADALFNAFYDPAGRIADSGEALQIAFRDAAQFARSDTARQLALTPATTDRPGVPPSPAAGPAQFEPLSMIAAAAHRGRVCIAHTGACHALLWRKGRLNPVTDALADARDIGFTRRPLRNGDILVLTTGALLQAVGEQRVVKVLRREKSTRRIVDALLGSATQFEAPDGVSVAVLRHVNPVARAALPVSLSLVTLAAAAVILMALFAGQGSGGGDNRPASLMEWIERLLPSFILPGNELTPTPSATVTPAAP